MKIAIAAACLLIASQTALADRVVKSSPHSVAATTDRLVAAVEKARAKVFARVDHAGGAKKVGQSLAPMQMVMLGNPELGTPALKAAATIGLDLPLRVLVFNDGANGVKVVYHDPIDVAASHGVAADHPVIKKMRGALNKLTNAAIGQ